MTQNSLFSVASFTPDSLQSPDSWVGHLPFAAWVIKEVAPKIFVELGTHSGNSYFSFCQSVAENNLATKCYAVDTWQGDEHAGQYNENIFTDVSAHNQQHYAGFSRLLRMTFDAAADYFGDESIELLHIDGLHTYEAVYHDFETWLPKLAPGAVVLFHDTNVRERNFGVWKLWEELQVRYPNNIEFVHSHGLGVLQLNNAADDKILGWLQPNSPEKQCLINYFAALGSRQLDRFESIELKQHAYNLGQLVVERDGQIGALTRIVSDLNKQIVNLYRRETNLHLQSNKLQNELRKEIMDYRLSTSWRITKPLRAVSLLRQRLVRLIRLYRDYRHVHPGIRGLVRLLGRSMDTLRKGGLKGLLSNIVMHEKSRSISPQPTFGPILALKDINDDTVALPQDVAVHIHIYYAELATEIRTYLINIPVNVHCYVTTDSQEKTKLIETAFADMSNIHTLDIRVVENRGRDLAPMIVALGAELARHEVVLHIHTKRSPHNLELRGWRRYLMLTLLGNTQRITAILHQFAQNKQLGILFPQVYRPVLPFMRIGGNTHYMASLLKRSGNDSAEVERINPVDFPAGAMFWFRGKAIEPLVRMQLTLQDFDEEAGQCDATLAHAIERLFPYFASKNGLYHQAYLPKQLLSSLPGTAPLSLFSDYCAQGLINNPVIMFDHNIGGGANRYSRELINTILAENSAVIRIYYADENWLVEWVDVDDGLIFNVSGEEELFDTLSKIGSNNIILNSLYGYPNVNDAISRIIDLTERLKANLDFKIHDFYAICPSQHLMDLNGRYCNVPINHSDCNACLKKNTAAHWASNRPIDIAEWRSPFAKLFAAAHVISIFDPSSINILHKAFQLKDSKLNIIPHNDGYFKCSNPMDLSGRLHIGVLGTLIAAKGAAVVNELAEYFMQQGMYIPITIVGQSLVSTLPRINVLGPYENNALPEILSHEGINVILMPTIVPETFSYTISEAMKMGLPIVAFDIGAQGNRVKHYELGKVIPLGSSPEVILAAIQSALNTAKELKK